MDTKQVANKHRELRDAAISKQLESALEFLDKEDLKQKLLTKIVSKYSPKLTDVIDVLSKLVDSKVKDVTSSSLETIIHNEIESLFDSHLKNKIAKMIDEEIDDRFKQLIKYNDEY